MTHVPRDHYNVLGVPRTATPEAIRSAYRHLVKRTHPDRDPSPWAAQRFMEVHRAYEVLRDPLQRFAYDARFRPYTPPPMPRRRTEDAHDMDHRHWAFVGLHLTGLVFGLALVIGILLGITIGGWPWYALLFTAPGFIVIPDAWAGLRM
ncbi:MAG: J domain-containing protein [Flavobacteriales bacterium]